jgi:nicotinamide-nucleotide amidase
VILATLLAATTPLPADRGGAPVIVEVIAVGTELLLGQIVNTNVAVIGSRLADEGFDAHFQVTVGDNLDRLAAAIRTAIDRADAVILTGGIGPTQDDLTREALCAVGDRTMVRDEPHAESIRQRLTRIRGYVAESTLRMADHPRDATPLPNRNGVALGIAMTHGGVPIFAMPGVPSEMAVMLDEQVMPRLRAASGEPASLRSRVLRTWGSGESQVAEELNDLYASTNPTVAFLVDGGEVRVRISAKAGNAETADKLIAGVEEEVVRRLGPIVFGRDDDTVEAILVRELTARRWSLATVEVATLGTVASTFAATSGAIPAFAGSLTVPPARGDEAGDLDRRARDLLAQAATTLRGDVVVAVSEARGDQADARATQSLVIAVRTPLQERARTVSLLGDDARIREYARGAALHLARLAVTGAWWQA